MKKQLITIVMLLGLMVIASARMAQAQIVDRIEADIPFSFYVEEKLLPAGQYSITEKEPGVMLIRSDDARAAAFFFTEEKREMADPVSSQLIFNKYGDEVFLSQIVEKGERDAAELLKSKLEKRIKRDGEEVEKVSLIPR